MPFCQSRMFFYIAPEFIAPVEGDKSGILQRRLLIYNFHYWHLLHYSDPLLTALTLALAL